VTANIHLKAISTRCAQRTQTSLRRCGEARWRPLASENISCQAASCNVKGSGKVVVDPRPDSDQHQNFIRSRGSLLAHAYHVWLTSVNEFVSYPAHRQTDRQTNKQHQSHNSALTEQQRSVPMTEYAA